MNMTLEIKKKSDDLVESFDLNEDKLEEKLELLREVLDEDKGSLKEFGDLTSCPEAATLQIISRGCETPEELAVLAFITGMVHLQTIQEKRIEGLKKLFESLGE